MVLSTVRTGLVRRFRGSAAGSRGRSFNLIHLKTAFKVDFFPGSGAFQRSQIKRATREEFLTGGVILRCRVVAAEDILLAKLRWYREGGCVSDRQWTDIGDIIAVTPDLDRGYLDHWAAGLGVTELLARAIEGVRKDLPSL